MKNYNLPLTSLFLVMMSACSLNADVDNSNDNSNKNNDPPGTGGTSEVPENGGAGGSSNGGTANGGNSNAGTSAGGTASVNVDGGIEAGAGGDIGIGGTVSFADAGVDADVIVQPEPLPEPEPEPRVCNTPNAIGSDQGNWFTTNAMNTEFRSHWFQLIDADGFVDSCTYVGQIKWYHPVTDQLGYVWYESVGLIDNPITILTIHFDDDGLVSNVIRSDGLVLPGMGYSRGNCYSPDLSDRDQAFYGLDREYQLKHCFYNRLNYHGLGGVGIFRGTWANDFSKPVLIDLLPEPTGF